MGRPAGGPRSPPHAGRPRAKDRAAVHDDTVLPAAGRLYTTAAPRIFRRPDDRPADPDYVALSMDEEEVFGPVLHEYSPEQAIADGVAARFRLQIKALSRPAPGHRPARTTPPATIGASGPDVVTPQLFCTHSASRRTIRVTLAEALMPGDSPLSGRDSSCCHGCRVDDVVITVNHAGASSPDATITAMIRPAHRATGNDWAEVVRTHAGLQHILRGLRDWDPDFGSALDAARAHGPDRHRDLLRWITIEPPESAPSGLVDDLLAALADSGAHDWWVGYGHLVAHHARTGNLAVPIRHKVDGYPLGQWHNVTRSTYLLHGVPLDRYAALHALGPALGNMHDVNRRRDWEQNIAAAQAFHARHGHLDVDLPGTDAPKGFRAWVSRVRSGAWPVSEAERAALDALGMLWDDRQLLRRKAVVAAFADYHDRCGTLDFPDDCVVEVRGERTRLINWVNVFRNEHRLGTVHPHLRRALEDLGFVFDPDAAWWQDLMTTARRYHERHGDLDVAPGAVHTAAGQCLFAALRNCRARSWRRALDPDRAAILNGLDPRWGTLRTPSANLPKQEPPQPAPSQPADRHVLRRPVPPPQPVPSASAAWQANLHAAWRHRDRFGHLLPATDYRDPLTGRGLTQWLSHQRWARRYGRLTAEQIAALDALDMIWDPTATFRRLGIQHARSYHAQHGHLRVPTTAPYHGTDARGEPYNLYNALARARNDHAKDALHPEWRQALNELGYDYTAWSPLPDYVATLEAYHADHGDLNISQHHPAYTSLARVHDARRRSAVPDDLQQRLDDIGYGNELQFTDWDDVFTVVQQFYNKYGHIDVPPGLRTTRPDGGQGALVGTWLANQRRRWRMGRTTKRQKEKLDAVGYIWDAEEAEWMAKYRLACWFRREHGHLAVTKVHVRENRDWAPLPGWLRKQATLRTARRLNDKRIDLLNRIGMPWVERPGREHHWEQRLQQVDDFRRTHGHTHILAQLNRTTDTSEREALRKLAAWLNDQLVYAKRGALRADRREKLTAIGITVPTPRTGGP